MDDSTKPIDVYFWPTPNGRKITVMLEELGVPYNLHLIDIGKGDQFHPDYLAISPNNRIPAIVDPVGPDGKPISIFESGAILMYLGRKFRRFYPIDDPRAQVAVEEWLFWQMANFGPMLGQTHHFRLYAPQKIPYAITRYENEAHRLYGVLDTRLREREFLADEFSIADIATFCWARAPDRQGIDLSEFPHAAQWHDRMSARPAVQRGMAVGSDIKHDISKDKDAQAILFNQRADMRPATRP